MLTAAAANVTEVPRQEGFTGVVMEIAGVSTGFTVIVTWFDNAGFPVAQL